MFKPYEAKPITRMAYEVQLGDHIDRLDDSTSEIFTQWGGCVFKHYEPVKPGDYIVRLTETDTYHCTRAVFHERNIVPGGAAWVLP